MEARKKKSVVNTVPDLFLKKGLNINQNDNLKDRHSILGRSHQRDRLK
jgi:hypothetical protein